MSGSIPPHLKAAAAALQAQRAVLGDAAVDAALAALLATARPPAAATPQRRQVTILFMDVVGSTRLSQFLDPEDIQQVLDGLLARCTGRIQAHGGAVLQYAGDNILAAFGTAQAQEDDAQRALLAGLDLLVLGREEGAEVLRRFTQPGFDVRVGVHTGSVLLGGGVDAEGTIRGMAVNVAARLEQLAPPGAMRISRDTWLHVRGAFECEEQAPLQLKGVDGPLVTYLVRRALPPQQHSPGRGVVGLAVPLVGRQAELGQLQAGWALAQAVRQPQAISVVADAGVGKSRLLAEFERLLPPGTPHWTARALPHTRTQAYGLLRHLLCRLSGIAEDDQAAQALARLQATLAPSLGADAEPAAALLGQLIGLDCSHSLHVKALQRDSRLLCRRALQLLARALRHHAGSGLVVLLDDLHWADDASLDAVAALAEAAVDVPLLWVCGTRPSLLQAHPAWGQALPAHQALHLAPLADAGAALADALLANVAAPPPELRALLQRQSEGNPFYMEELLQMLIDDGVVDARGKPWTVHLQRLGQLRVPTTLAGVLQARLDSLSADMRSTLQRASVVGPVFWDVALRHVAPPTEPPDDALAQLQRQGPVEERPRSTFSASREYRFRHHLLQQVTYDTVLKREREPLHRRTAQWLLMVAGERLGEHAALVAEHFERAGDPLEAARYLHKAALAAKAGTAVAMAQQHIERALALLPPGELSLRYELVATRLQVAIHMGQREVQERCVHQLLDLAEALDNPALRASAHGWHGQWLLVAGHYAQVEDAARQSRHWAQRAGDMAGQSAVLSDLGHALHLMGRSNEALQVLEQARQEAREQLRVTDEVIACSRLSAIHNVMGQVAQGLVYMDDAVGLAERAGDLRLSLGLRSNLGLRLLQLGQLQRAGELIRAALAGFETIGDRPGQAYSWWALSDWHDVQGQLAEALQASEAALAISTEVRDHGLHARLALSMVGLAAEAGQLPRAVELMDMARQAATTVPLVREALVLEAACLDWNCGRHDQAHRAILALLDELDPPATAIATLRVPLLWRVWVVLQAGGQAQGSARVLQLAWERLQRQMQGLSPAQRQECLQGSRFHRLLADAWASQQG